MHLELLATVHGQPLQTWEFGDQPLIHIGRAAECDVVISSPVVSRSHAFIKREGAGWLLCAVSQNGVFMEGERVQSVPLQEGLVFRLAATGPFVRFGNRVEQGSAVMQTILPEESGVSTLQLDAQKRDEQVEAIVDGAYFQQLQELARKLREQKKE